MQIWFGMLCAVSMILTGSFDVYYQEIAHNVFAVLTFVFGVLHEVVFYMIFTDLLSVFSTHLWMMRVSLIMLVPINVLLLISIGTVVATCQTTTCIRFVLDGPVAIEYSTVLALLLYLYGYAYLFGKECYLAAVVEPRRTEDSNNAEIENEAKEGDEENKLGNKESTP